MTEPRPIYRTDGEWMALVYRGNIYDTMGEWVGWLDGDEVFSLEGEYVGYASQDGRLLRRRVSPYRKRRSPPSEAPRCPVPSTVPLPPLFAELGYETVDVFEETPDIFALVNELRPDAGEKRLPRLVDFDPRLAERQRLRTVKQDMLEQMTYSLIYSYRADEPPVPIEAMAAGRPPDDRRKAETTSPSERVRLAEGLIARLGHSSWAMERGFCGPAGFSAPEIDYATRALLMPRHWVLRMSKDLRRPRTLAHRYVVPEELAVLRLHDLEQ